MSDFITRKISKSEFGSTILEEFGFGTEFVDQLFTDNLQLAALVVISHGSTEKKNRILKMN